MAATQTGTIRDYADYLDEHPEEVAELVMAFLIKVTEFFRDPAAFEFLRREILPEIIRQGRERGRTLRLWSAGCATGEEPYSLALLVADLLGAELHDWSIKIFATACSAAPWKVARPSTCPASPCNSPARPSAPSGTGA